MLDREKTAILGGKIKYWKAVYNLQHFLKRIFSIQKTFPILAFFPTEDGNVMPLLMIWTLHPLSDFIHCNKVSGTEREHSRKAKMSKPTYNEKYNGIPNKSSEYNYTHNYMSTASLCKKLSFLPINMLKCACATCIFNWSIELRRFFHSQHGEVRRGAGGGCLQVRRLQCRRAIPVRFTCPTWGTSSSPNGTAHVLWVNLPCQ